MRIRTALCLWCLLSGISVARAEGEPAELLRVRRQAQEEHIKEVQIQMMRLELEKLKLEVETRKVMTEIGLPMASPISGSVPKINVEVKNITGTASDTKAEIEAGGSRKSVRAGDAVGPLIVKRIEPDTVILVDEKGIESRVGAPL